MSKLFKSANTVLGESKIMQKRSHLVFKRFKNKTNSNEFELGIYN